MKENPDLQHDYWSRTAISIYKFGHDCIRLMKWFAYYDSSYYENENYYDLLGSILNELCKYTYNCKYIFSINTNRIVSIYILKKFLDGQFYVEAKGHR